MPPPLLLCARLTLARLPARRGAQVHGLLAESGAALEAQERKSKTYNTWKEKMVVDNKTFHVLWTGGSGLKAKHMPLLKDKPQNRILKTMPHKGGLQPDHPYPGSMYTKDSYVDPIETYIVDTYGTFLRFEDK